MIVEFREPAAARAALDAGGSNTDAITSAVYAEQDKVLTETFGAKGVATRSGHVDRMDICRCSRSPVR